MAVAFSGIEACVFDAYGTLFDVHAPLARMSERIGEKAAQVSQLWRQKQLEYTWLRSLMREHADFWSITNDALDYALAAFGINDPVVHEKLLDLYLALEAYPDARECLETLARRGIPAAVLSNGTPAMLEAAARSANLRELIGEIISVEEVGVFKPDPRVYGRALARLSVTAPESILFVSANTWDAQGARCFGFNVARIDRFGVRDENLPGRPQVVLKSLSDVGNLIAAP
jgi:2-haloacid dehalogenase